MSVREPDVVLVGAGHNGLAAGALLAKRGLRVLLLEKNRYVGGMAGTREILAGCRNDVGASLLFPLARGLAEELELARYGVELLDLPIMSCSLSAPGDPPGICMPGIPGMAEAGRAPPVSIVTWSNWKSKRFSTPPSLTNAYSVEGICGGTTAIK